LQHRRCEGYPANRSAQMIAFMDFFFSGRYCSPLLTLFCITLWSAIPLLYEERKNLSAVCRFTVSFFECRTSGMQKGGTSRTAGLHLWRSGGGKTTNRPKDGSIIRIGCYDRVRVSNNLSVGGTIMQGNLIYIYFFY
jgi:hypothetical protein